MGSTLKGAALRLGSRTNPYYQEIHCTWELVGDIRITNSSGMRGGGLHRGYSDVFS